jgi:hypothetical protein
MPSTVEAEVVKPASSRTPLRRAIAILRVPRFWLAAFGFDPLRMVRALGGIARVFGDYFRFRRLHRGVREWPISLSAPCPGDRHTPSGETRGHYFWQDLYVAQHIFAASPAHHIDVGSRVDGFVAHVASFRPLTVLDIRRTEIVVSNVTFMQCDLLNLPPDMIGTADSVSCLHALEHLGLGRYGDIVGRNLYEQGISHLSDLLMPQGMLYLSVPIGRQRVEFNAHRVFAVDTILDVARATMDLTRFSFIDDDGLFHPNTDPLSPQYARLTYGCGIFEFRKR